MYDCTLANSFDADYELYYGTDAAVMLRENKAWMFKEVDSPLGGWEVYAKKETFFKEAGIVLMLGSSKQSSFEEKPQSEIPYATATLSSALDTFLRNADDFEAAEQAFVASERLDRDGIPSALRDNAEGGSIDPNVAHVLVPPTQLAEARRVLRGKRRRTGSLMTYLLLVSAIAVFLSGAMVVLRWVLTGSPLPR